MPTPADELNKDEIELGKRIGSRLCHLRHLVDADYIRFWRYVDSQKVIFGFRWFSDSDEDRTSIEDFTTFVGFRRQSLQQVPGFHPVTLKDGEHPHWYFPEFKKLKTTPRGFIEAVLARGEQEHELDGLICAGTDAKTWGSIQLDKRRVSEINQTLTELQSLIQLFSLLRFHSAFISGGEERWPRSSFLDPAQEQTPKRVLETLANELDHEASFYLRNPGDLTLYAGFGQFYDQLRIFEDPDGANALACEDYRRALITRYAATDAEKQEHPVPMLYPGSPAFEGYQAIRDRFDSWIATVTAIADRTPAMKHVADRLVKQFNDIGHRGSFGVFPVSASDIPGPQAYLCCASRERNFFRWRARIAIRDACQWLAHNLPAAQPFRNLLHRVRPDIGAYLRTRADFRDKLLPKSVVQSRDRIRKRRSTDRDSKDDVYLKTPVPAFVMSVDVRHSTQLMRDTLRPEEFAAFLTNMSRDLAGVVKAHYGIFDKFTGDGILAFFPICIFKDDAHATALRTIAAAEECHAVFEKLFGSLRRHLAIVEAPQGLGIGIDYGDVSLVDVSGELTVVGSPVVYACRLAAAPAGCTIVNEQAYQHIRRRDGCAHFEEIVLPTKDRNMRARLVPRYWSQDNALPTNFYWT